MKKDKEESEIVEAMINNAGDVGTTLVLRTSNDRPTWVDSVDKINGIVKLHCDDLLRRKGFTRKAHEEATEIKKHWERILQG